MFFLGCRDKCCIQTDQKISEFTNIEWLNSPPQRLTKLKESVVLIRWWTDECIYCINSADALNEWHQKFQNDKFQILGFYHVKPKERIVESADVIEFSEDKGFKFPIGIDKDWINLRKYWCDCHNYDFTSISILLDKTGRIRYIHPGGEYHKDYEKGHDQCVNAYYRIDSLIKQLIEE